MLLTRIRPSLFIPCIEIMWGVLTLSLTACKSYKTMCVVRFFVGLFESALYPGFIYIIGSWYRSDELAKRTCIFQVTNAVGSMFSGYLMAAVYHLEGVGGFKGWQW
jgi:MFS transporter, ACS family, pantothenate transporter